MARVSCSYKISSAGKLTKFAKTVAEITVGCVPSFQRARAVFVIKHLNFQHGSYFVDQIALNLPKLQDRIVWICLEDSRTLRHVFFARVRTNRQCSKTGLNAEINIAFHKEKEINYFCSQFRKEWMTVPLRRILRNYRVAINWEMGSINL